MWSWLNQFVKAGSTALLLLSLLVLYLCFKVLLPSESLYLTIDTDCLANPTVKHIGSLKSNLKTYRFCVKLSNFLQPCQHTKSFSTWSPTTGKMPTSCMDRDLSTSTSMPFNGNYKLKLTSYCFIYSNFSYKLVSDCFVRKC